MGLEKEYLSGLFEYNPNTGTLIYKTSSRGHRAGAIAGTVLNNGYIQVYVEGKKELAHRVIWAMVHGEPPKFIDHINGDRKDNRVSNLRESTPRKNQQNRVEHREHNRLVGATFTKQMVSRPWRSIIRIQGKNVHLGYFETELEAHETYLRACDRLANA